MIKSFLFKIIYFVFKDIIDEKMNEMNPGFVTSFFVDSKGLTKVYVSKVYPEFSSIALYENSEAIYDSNTHKCIGQLKKIYATGKVVAKEGNSSVVLLNQQDIEIKTGLLSTVI